MVITWSSRGHHMLITWSSHQPHASLPFLSRGAVASHRHTAKRPAKRFCDERAGTVARTTAILLHAGAMDSNDRSFVASLSKFDPILNSRSLPFGSPCSSTSSSTIPTSLSKFDPILNSRSLPFGSPSSSTSSSTIQTPCQRSMTSDAASK